jgi:hypothetical protein
MFCCPEISVVDQVLHGGISVTATKKNEKKKIIHLITIVINTIQITDKIVMKWATS